MAIHGMYCPAHMKEIMKLFVQESTISGAGLGLFTSEDIKENTRIVPYVGKFSSSPGFATAKHGPYVMQSDDTDVGQTFVNSNHISMGVGRLINDGCYKHYNNVKIVIEKDIIVVVAVRLIKAGQELLGPYGDTYWPKVMHLEDTERRLAQRQAIDNSTAAVSSSSSSSAPSPTPTRSKTKQVKKTDADAN